MNIIPLIDRTARARKQMACQGYFTLIARDSRTGRSRVLTRFPNMILDQALERLGTGNINPAYCQVGSGTATPAANQTSLTTYVAGQARTAQSSVAYVAGSEPYIRRVYTYAFATGAVVGNISELGVGWAASGATLNSRALVLDESGVPTTYPVQPTEALIVTYELRLYPNITDYVTTYMIDGVSTTVTVRPSRISTTAAQGWSVELLTSGLTTAGVTDYSGSVGDIFSTPSGTQAGGATSLLQAYSANSRYRDYQITWGPSAGLMAGGVGAILFGFSYGSFQASFSPKLTKTNTQTRVLTFRFPWARK